MTATSTLADTETALFAQLLLDLRVKFETQLRSLTQAQLHFEVLRSAHTTADQQRALVAIRKCLVTLSDENSAIRTALEQTADCAEKLSPRPAGTQG
jgi:hypothetical protein